MCSCASAVGHLSHCPLKNQGVRVDFSDLLKTVKKLENDCGQQNKRRDSKQIAKIIGRLEKLWCGRPYLRLGQLISNVFRQDFYFLEDEELLDGLEKFYKKNRV
ncbi:MAG: hypothetical protein A3H63_01060 [Candidatus Harrisonbacteria bacterium RIFCSPLOWO2_02_FULL_45_10c]|uniref:Uncharacterized protein n=1 Tax=Candidatus Harrisonbacteria bacterium RIFCSPLOWO2_02_FULL_45_10c TaxID=1798410 RepID=A0A1G1ZRX2_9BACT|nr:MAG: hypothetical protein A3H63_01060 [Candidatus Harrisonbacteria bacterium RIFCSPLOWO2_02_FULL_45_10c]